jgi:membrane protease YdiL (CAAX protease family)
MGLKSFDELAEPRGPFDSLEVQPGSPPRGSSLIAWLVIVAMVAVVLSFHAGGRQPGGDEPSIMISEIQARYLVGAAGMSATGEHYYKDQIETLFDKGSVRQRLMGAVLLGELVGPEAAAKSLDEIAGRIAAGTMIADEPDRDVLTILRRIQGARIEKTGLGDVLREIGQQQSAVGRLRERLGWVGRLAMVPAGTSRLDERAGLLEHARRTLFVILGVFGLGFVAIACGAILQVVWWVMVATDRVHSGIAPLRGNPAIYAETFAVWMTMFVALNFLISWLPLPRLGLVLVLIPQAGSLGALAWPLIRGLSWSDVCEDIGLIRGQRPWASPFIGIGTYLFALPVVAVGMVITLLMMAVASQFAEPGVGTQAPMHPIVEPILRGNWTARLQLLFLVVFAAVPEEIMFRGVLYRHLREAGTRFGDIGRVLFATLITSFVFAVIHPQGLFGVPILMGLASVFALVREWRGSLIPAMIAHAMVNAGTSGVLLLIAD